MENNEIDWEKLVDVFLRMLLVCIAFLGAFLVGNSLYYAVTI